MCAMQNSTSPYSSAHQQAHPMYPQQTQESLFWMPENTQTQDSYYLPNQISQETSYHEFPSYMGDFFQPEEIFQLDQPLKTEFSMSSQDVTRSPPTLLDLGSGTIKYETEKVSPDQAYWNQLFSEDSSSSHLSLSQTHDERYDVFETAKSNGFISKRTASSSYNVTKDTNHNHTLNTVPNYSSYVKPGEMKEYEPGIPKFEQDQGYWLNQRQDNKFFEPSKDAEVAKSGCNFQSRCMKNESLEQVQHPSHSPLSGNFSQFDNYQLATESNVTERNVGSTRILQERLTYEGQNPMAERLFPDQTDISNTQNSPEPYFYSSNDRCQYNCDDVNNRFSSSNQVTGNNHSVHYGDIADIDVPAFVDYTLVGMLCSSGDSADMNVLPDTQNYVPHH